MAAGRILRIELLAPARVRFSVDGWQTWADLDALETGVGVWVADIPGSNRVRPGAGVDFTMWWPGGRALGGPGSPGHGVVACRFRSDRFVVITRAATAAPCRPH